MLAEYYLIGILYIIIRMAQYCLTILPSTALGVWLVLYLIYYQLQMCKENGNIVFAENCYFIFLLGVNVYNATARNASYKQYYTSTFHLVFFIFETYITWREVFNEY